MSQNNGRKSSEKKPEVLEAEDAKEVTAQNNENKALEKGGGDDTKTNGISKEEMYKRVKQQAKKLDRTHTIQNDEAEEQHIIRVASDSPVERLGHHIVNTIANDGVAICQAIGAAANQKVDLAVVSARSTVSKHSPTHTLVIVPMIRKPSMDNGEERTAIRKRIIPIPSNLVI